MLAQSQKCKRRRVVTGGREAGRHHVGELQTKLHTMTQTGREAEYLEDCGQKWVELVRQGERLYPIWPRRARDEAANALLTALGQQKTEAENVGSGGWQQKTGKKRR